RMVGAAKCARDRLAFREAMAGRRPTGKRSNPEATRFFFAWRKHPWNYANLQRDSFLRFASSAKAPRPARICAYLQIVGKYYRLFGGEGGIRTPETLSSLHAFQACALNRARPPLRTRTRLCITPTRGATDALDRAAPARLKMSSGASRIDGSPFWRMFRCCTRRFAITLESSIRFCSPGWAGSRCTSWWPRFPTPADSGLLAQPR